MDSSPEQGSSESGDNRIEGLDVARALAIVGMVMVHFGPNSPPPDDWLSLFYGLSHGRASLLFVILAGIGMTLLVGHRNRERWTRAWPRLLVRISVLLPVGLALQLMDVSVSVILHFYAVFFLLAIPATVLRDGALLVCAGLTAIAGPVAYAILEDARPEWLIRYKQVALDDAPGVIVRELLFTGSYPAMVWMAPFLFGMWLGRRQLNNLGTRLALFVSAVTVVAASVWLGPLIPNGAWSQLASAEPHSQAIRWLVESTAAATAVLAVCLVLTDLLKRFMGPLIAMGQLALTIYVGHLFLVAAAPGIFTTKEVETAMLIVSTFTLGSLLFAVTWRSCFPRGPIEEGLHFLARCLAKRASGKTRISQPDR